MSLTNEQKFLIKTTFSQVRDADRLAARFYERLFEIDPSIKPLFKSDMKAQGQKLVQTIAVVVHAIDDLEPLIPAIESLGKRHAAYGVKIEHWYTVGNALLWTLEDAFGDAFTEDVRDAWASAYEMIASLAIAAQFAKEVA